MSSSSVALPSKIGSIFVARMVGESCGYITDRTCANVIPKADPSRLCTGPSFGKYKSRHRGQ
jgi:hypothetical protein